MAEEEEKSPEELKAAVRDYWNGRIHDVEMTVNPPGSTGFYEDLAEYRYDKNRYLLKLIDFEAYGGKKILELGCGVGLDLTRFARGGAQVTGIDLVPTAIDLAKTNFEINGLEGDLMVGDGEALEFPDDTFDLVYAHGALQYTADPQRMVDEARRVLKPGGRFFGQLYNRKGWLVFMSKVAKVTLEHTDAPAFHLNTAREFKQMLSGFGKARVLGERFPVKSRLQKGVKGLIYNLFFVNFFKLVPKPLVRRWGAHLIGIATK
ncbi:MAG TPA: class I SAM-dependent methyltransferase [Acidobacteriota bacterium]|nr:class I SAM-dependent methyltransferase [Acidobacteriota bacterium]